MQTPPKTIALVKLQTPPKKRSDEIEISTDQYKKKKKKKCRFFLNTRYTFNRMMGYCMIIRQYRLESNTSFSNTYIHTYIHKWYLKYDMTQRECKTPFGFRPNDPRTSVSYKLFFLCI